MPLRHRRINQKVFVHHFARGYLSRHFAAVIRVLCRTAATASDDPLCAAIKGESHVHDNHD